MPGKKKSDGKSKARYQVAGRSRECSCARLVEEQGGKTAAAGDSDSLHRAALTELERDPFLKALLGALREIDELDKSERARGAQRPPER